MTPSRDEEAPFSDVPPCEDSPTDGELLRKFTREYLLAAMSGGSTKTPDMIFEDAKYCYRRLKECGRDGS